MASPRWKKPNSKRKFSLTIENILKECHDFQSPAFFNMSKHMESQISNLSEIYGQLKTTDLNPVKFEASNAYKNGKKRLSAYIKSKYKQNDEMNKEKFKEMLHTHESPKQTQHTFTFNGFENDEISRLVMKNKRGFGQGWKFEGISNRVSPLQSGFPSVSNSPISSPHAEKSNLNKLITVMIDKQLGILPKKEIALRKKKSNKNRKMPINLIPIGINELGTMNEDKYLNPEYLQYNSNMDNKLKLQKLIVEKLNRERRQSVQELKSADANTVKYIE